MLQLPSAHVPSPGPLAALLTAVCLLGGQAPAPERASPDRSSVDPAVTQEDLRTAVAWLADDARAGRRTGSLEAVEAARWLAERLQAAGVQPASPEWGYLQPVPLARIEYTGLPALELELASGESSPAVYGVDFDFPAGTCEERRLAVRVVRSAEELAGPPAPDVALFLDAQGRQVRELLDAAGAGWGLVVLRGSDRQGRAPDLESPRSRRATTGDGGARLRVRGPLAQRLADGEVARLRVRLPGRRVEEPAFNVVGVLRGSGTQERPELADQAVVFSAHYDHIGTRADAAEGEDAIHNGADDDASGCAAVLELAEAFGAGPPPARTLVFLLATGEEIGLVGTRHYLDDPVVPLERTVCNLNFEMIGRPDALAGGPGRLWLTGFERSNLGPAFAGAGLAVVPDPRPDQNFFQRSDNYAFAVRGVVAQSLSSYDLHGDYHQVTDEVERIDFAHMQAAVEAALAGARALASGAIDPAWSPDGDPRR